MSVHRRFYRFRDFGVPSILIDRVRRSFLYFVFFFIFLNFTISFYGPKLIDLLCDEFFLLPIIFVCFRDNSLVLSDINWNVRSRVKNENRARYDRFN